jgi:hypothetical protein
MIGPDSSAAPAANAERQRLSESDRGEVAWKRWGPYLSERQWGTVREDYSENGNAWEYLPHDHARSRAYRWGEDGIAGVSDDMQRLCLALALWNGNDPILKERMFGLTNAEGNHGEDVKELYYYLDATPTHSYLKMLYKYPQVTFPYRQLVEESRRRGISAPEFEIINTGVFDEDRYFDVEIEYAKAAPEDILMRITINNRGLEPATIHVLPQLWFRNTWSWRQGAAKPSISMGADRVITARHQRMGRYELHCEGRPEILFSENETNTKRLFAVQDAQGPFKDAFHDYLLNGSSTASVNQNFAGTKCAIHHHAVVPARGAAVFRLRLTAEANKSAFGDFDLVCAARKDDADAFYVELQKDIAGADERLVQRQAFAGMIWSKQFYHIDVARWIDGDPAQPSPPERRKHGRNHEWRHLNNADILSMPDKWEYPWYAAWDLAFHCIPLALIDATFAKEQLLLLGRVWYMHPNGQLPAYEWAFGDVNPPVHAWACWRVFQIDRDKRGDAGDLAFLERIFHKLLLNFTWWVNRKDPAGRNVFQGGFLGLDNIGIFDRSAPLPTGGHLEQSDGTAWMAMYCLKMMRISLELALHNEVYQDTATKFFEHFLYIAQAMTDMGEAGVGLWDQDDEFFYDVLYCPTGEMISLRVRSMVGLIPLFAVEVLEPDLLERLPDFKRRLQWFLTNRPKLSSLVSRWQEPGQGERRLLSLLRGHRMKRLLSRALDEAEFLSDYGVRSVSKFHEQHPFVFEHQNRSFSIGYQPGESESTLFGGNSNWRGPVWFPLNYMLIESLQRFHEYYGDDFKIECPTRSGTFLTMTEVAEELTRRLTSLFLLDRNGQRPIFGDYEKFQSDPNFKNRILFHEYFHGDSGQGLGASHQTGWTGLVAKLLQSTPGNNFG